MNQKQTIAMKIQQGSVLPVSLFILLVLTIIGATSLNSSVMEEKMSSNFQSGNLAFQATESSVNRTFMTVSNTTDLANQAVDAWQVSDSDTPPVWPNDTPYPDNDDIPNEEFPSTLTARVEYRPFLKSMLQGCTLSEGMPTKCSAMALDVVATGRVTGTTVQRTHTQGVNKPLPAGSGG